MIKFLLSLPLAIFILLEAFIVYQLGNVLFRATNENIAGLVGDWSFFQIVLAMVGVMMGLVLAAFLYIIVVLKPVFYPSLEQDKPKRKNKRRPAEPENNRNNSKLKLIIILAVIGAVVIALAVTGVIFRESIGNFFSSIFSSGSSETEIDDYWDQYTQEEDEDDDQTAVEENQPEPEVITRASYADVIYNWTLFYPVSLIIIDTEPVDTWDSVRAPSDTNPQLLYWSEANNGRFSGAEDYAANDPDGIVPGVQDTRV